MDSRERTQRGGSRIDYTESYRWLQENGWIPEGQVPALPERVPRHDDEFYGVRFFRTWVDQAHFENLTIPRTYVSRSEISDTSLKGSDLSESSMSYNDFNRVKFNSALLRNADLRASVFKDSSFDNADLSGADLRHAQFESCTFKGATMTGVRMTREAAKSLALSDEQRTSIDWQGSEGEEPEGG